MSDPQNFRHPLVSLLQSAAGAPGMSDDLVRATETFGFMKTQVGAVPMAAPPGIAAKAWECVKLGSELMDAARSGNAAEIERLHAEITFSTCDPRWVSVLTDYLNYFGSDGKRAAIPYIRAAQVGETVLTMPAGATIALVGDWGTGTNTAIGLLREVAQHKPDVLIHLGDIYYSGTGNEVEANFSAGIKSVFPDGIPTYTLCGNHDVYSGGAGFYALLKSLGQPASFFCLRSADNLWQFCALDTGKNDYDPFDVTTNLTCIEEDEEDWITRRIAEFSGKTILLSHHQLFSALEQIGPVQVSGRLVAHNLKLSGSFDRFSAAAPGRIAAWFWGHEHALSIYEPYLGLGKGRCVGHGAVPVFVNAPANPAIAMIADPPKLIDVQLDADGDVFKHGYAIIRLGVGMVDYYQSGDTDPLFTEGL
jgi:hypothetical protein